ncbi:MULTISPECIES: hypothetical protein [unclassified Acinetobacter]|uniref:DUF7716 domain-containing protein n=1 Tax=unclassified Acinetobacter TaxID=196816 RepID=UPI00124F3992|nr:MULTISPECIES: hypothetical protein [unclassified Acinetobacter]
MTQIVTIRDLYETAIRAKENEWIYVNLIAWNKSPKESIFFIISEEEVDNLPDEKVYESDDGAFLPIALQELYLSPWMEISTLKGVIENLKLISNNFNDESFIQGINYYREYDTFLDA